VKVITTVFVAVLWATPSVFALEWVKKPTMTNTTAGQKISFELSALTDVEVAILNSKGKVVRHLAAGVLGPKAPRPFKPNSKAQALTWNGKDDYGQPAKGGPFKLRVRAGMGVELEQIVGGDPYAWYSHLMGQGDHALWRIMGIDVKPDGTVYVLGNSTMMGPPAIRAYTAEGKYIKTVFPPPAGLPVEKVKGWGVNAKPDGTYSFKYKDLFTCQITMTRMCSAGGWPADLIPTPEPDKLLISHEGKTFFINTDGTIAPDAEKTGGRLVNNPSMVHPERNAWKTPWKIRGTVFTCLSPDKKSMYVGGIYAGTMARLRCVGAETKGFWRDGRVYKVDVATRTAKPFFSFPATSIPVKYHGRGVNIGDCGPNPYAALHGVAVDKAGNVFVCDRLNGMVLVLGKTGKKIKQIPVKNPDAIAVHPKTKAIFVTTRSGNYHKKGKLDLLKFNDWSKAKTPSVTIPLASNTGTYPPRSYLAVTESKGKTLLWLAYVTLPIRIYEDSSAGLKQVKDFYHSGIRQRCLDLQHFAVDPKNERIYVADGWKKAWVLKDWSKPKFELATTSTGANPPRGACVCYAKGNNLAALSLAIDYRKGYIYTHDYARGKIKHALHRYKIEDKCFPPAPIGNTGSYAISGSQIVFCDWNICAGHSQRGLAVAPCGCVAVLSSSKLNDFSGPLWFFKYDAKAVPWKPMAVPSFGSRPDSGGIRFDPAGNMYVGKLIKHKDAGVILKYKPTGSPSDGCLYPTPPAAPVKTYNVRYGYPAPRYSRTPRFGVDGYGRISFPTSLEPKVSLMDNRGNVILSFGTYGNRDSMGGLERDLVPTKDIPMAFPNSVDATDDYIYVSDMVNLRLLRIKKTFKLEG